MKQEKDPRINARDWSIKLYLLTFLGFAATNGFHIWILIYFLERGMNETHTMLVINIFMAYTFIVAGLYMAGFIIVRNIFWNRQIRTISEAAKKIAHGDFTIRIPPSRKDGKKDYIEVMFDDFNTMTEEPAVANEKLKTLSITDINQNELAGDNLKFSKLYNRISPLRDIIYLSKEFL